MKDPLLPDIDTRLGEILKDYKQDLSQQMGFILSGKHRLDIKSADKIMIDTPIQAIKSEIIRMLETLKEHKVSKAIEETGGIQVLQVIEAIPIDKVDELIGRLK